METNISMDNLEKTAKVFMEQIKEIKMANLQNLGALKSQKSTQKEEFDNLNDKYSTIVGELEEARNSIEVLEKEKKKLNESIHQIQTENKIHNESVALLEKDNKQLLANQQKFLEGVKKALEYSSKDAFQNPENETESILKHLQAEIGKWKSGQEELARTRKIMSEVGKYFQNNSASFSEQNSSNGANATISNSQVDNQTAETKPDFASHSVNDLANKTSHNFTVTNASLNTDHSDSMESQPLSEQMNVRNRKQLTPFVKTRKCHGRVKDSLQYRCLCGFTYKSRIGLHVHVRKMTQRWEHNCKTCGQYFFYASELQKHWNTSNCSRNLSRSEHFDNDPQDLSLNRKQLLQKSKLIAPRLKQFQKNKYKSAVWNPRAFHNSRTAFRTRNTAIGDSANWKFNCKICHSRFQYLAYLKKHMAGTHNNPDYLNEYVRGCQLCGDMFQTNQKYWKHRANVHNLKRKSNDKPLASQYEPTEVASNESEGKMPALVAMAAHSSKEIIPTKRIMIERYLKDQAHLKTLHAPLESASLENGGFDDNDRQHKCHCGKVYLSRTALMHHVKSMKYGMIFKCLRCFRGFTQLVNLQSHMSAMHHEDCTEFACGSCDKIFWKRKDFILHCQAEHDTNYE